MSSGTFSCAVPGCGLQVPHPVCPSCGPGALDAPAIADTPVTQLGDEFRDEINKLQERVAEAHERMSAQQAHYFREQKETFAGSKERWWKDPRNAGPSILQAGARVSNEDKQKFVDYARAVVYPDHAKVIADQSAEIAKLTAERDEWEELARERARERDALTVKVGELERWGKQDALRKDDFRRGYARAMEIYGPPPIEKLARALFDLEMRGEASKIAEVNLADRAGSGLALIEGDQKIRGVLQTMWERTKVDVRAQCLAKAQEIVEAMQ